MKVENLEGKKFAPRLKPAAPIPLAAQNPFYYPSHSHTILKIKRWFDDILKAHAIRSTQELSEEQINTLDAPDSKVRSDFPASIWQAAKHLRLLPPKARTRVIFELRKKGVDKLEVEFPEGQEYVLRLEPVVPI